jgi:hypothetical protein
MKLPRRAERVPSVFGAVIQIWPLPPLLLSVHITSPRKLLAARSHAARVFCNRRKRRGSPQSDGVGIIRRRRRHHRVIQFITRHLSRRVCMRCMCEMVMESEREPSAVAIPLSPNENMGNMFFSVRPAACVSGRY